jgi:hypothetical protein
VIFPAFPVYDGDPEGGNIPACGGVTVQLTDRLNDLPSCNWYSLSTGDSFWDRAVVYRCYGDPDGLFIYAGLFSSETIGHSAWWRGYAVSMPCLGTSNIALVPVPEYGWYGGVIYHNHAKNTAYISALPR